MRTETMEANISLGWEAVLSHAIRFLFMVSVFLAIFSPSMVYVAAFSALLCLVLPGCRAGLPALLRLPSVRFGWLYFLVVIAGIFYTPAIKHDITKELLVVALPVFFLPLLTTVFHAKRWQHHLIIALFSSAVFVAARMFASSQHLIPYGWSHIFLFRDNHYIQEAATVAALGIYLGLYLALEARTPTKRAVFAVLSICLIVVSLGFQQERVGMVLSFVSLSVFFLQHLRKLRWLALMVVGYALLATVTYQVSPVMKYRLDKGFGEINALIAKRASVSSTAPKHAPHVESTEQTSFGLRYHTAAAALEASTHRPIFGYGTGAFSMSHKSNPPLSGDLLKYLNTTTPEMGSLFVLMRHGWLGVLVFMVFLFSWWWVCRPLGYNRSCMVFGTLVVLVLADCSYPSFYHSRAWVWLFAVLIAVAGGLLNNGRPNNSKGKNAHENLTG